MNPNFSDNHGKSENCLRNKRHDKSRGRSKSRPKLVCYYCIKPGRKKFDCHYYMRDHKVEKLICVKLNTTKEIKALLLLLQKMTMMCSSSKKKIISIYQMMIVHGLLTWVLISMSLHMNNFSDLTKVVTLVMSRWEIKFRAKLLVSMTSP